MDIVEDAVVAACTVVVDTVVVDTAVVDTVAVDTAVVAGTVLEVVGRLGAGKLVVGTGFEGTEMGWRVARRGFGGLLWGAAL